MEDGRLPLFDSHCHLTDERLLPDLETVLERAAGAGVDGLVTIASDVADAEMVRDLVRDRTTVWGTAGIHPHEAASARDGDLERIRDLLAEPRMVAVGETGLDYHYDHSPRPVQRRLFAAQVELAEELDLPLVVHSREAEDDTADVVRETGRTVRGVLHCFTGGDRLLRAALDADWYVSFSGITSFSGFGEVEAVRTVPADRLLIETDAPYLAPAPHRGRRNEPAYVARVAEAVAAHRNEPVRRTAGDAHRNARRFYRLDER